MLKIRKFKQMTENSAGQEVNSSTILNHTLKFISNQKIGLLIICFLSLAYSLYIGYNYQPLYRSTSILDTKEIIQRDVMKEMVHDYFKSTNLLSVKKHLIRTDAVKNGTRFYLDIYAHITDYSTIEKELINYINSNEIVQFNLANKIKTSSVIVEQLNKQLAGDSSVKNSKLEILKEIENLNQLLLITENFNPIEKGFGIAEEVEKIRAISIKSFFKAFLSGILVLFAIAYFKKN